MATKIEWAKNADGTQGKTWNPVTGCTKISPACDHCYAERMSHRLAGRCGYPSDDPFRVTLHPDKLEEPLHWQKPTTAFVVSMGDLFHDAVPFSFIGKVWAIMDRCRQHRFLVLTKRPERLREAMAGLAAIFGASGDWPLPNVGLGVTVESQHYADERLPVLMDTPAAWRWVSCEPLLGPLDLTRFMRCPPCGPAPSDCAWAHWRLDWCVVGAETGPGARPMDPMWAREIRDQCVATGVPLFIKKVNAKGDRELDGRTWEEMPKQLGGAK